MPTTADHRGYILATYSISHKKVKVPYRTRIVLIANLERTSGVPLIAQRTQSSVRFGTLRFSAVRCGTARYGGCDTRIPTRDRSRTGSRTASDVGEVQRFVFRRSGHHFTRETWSGPVSTLSFVL